MNSLEPLVRNLLWYLIPSLLLFVFMSIVFASLGLSIGFRKLYMLILLSIFEVSLIYHKISSEMSFQMNLSLAEIGSKEPKRKEIKTDNRTMNPMPSLTIR